MRSKTRRAHAASSPAGSSPRGSSPPSATPATSIAPAAGWRRFGAALIVAAGLHVCWTVYGATGNASALLDDRGITRGRVVPPSMRAALAAAKEAATQQALVALAAAGIAVLMAALLVRIAFGIRRGSARDLERSRTWAFAAGALVVLWLGLRLSLVPAQARALELLREAMPAGSGGLGPDIVGSVAGSLVTSPLLAASAQLLLPVIVAVWATRLMRAGVTRDSRGN